MIEELNQKYSNILSQCLKFKKFNKLYGSLSKCIKPEFKERFETFQKTEDYFTHNGRDQWQIINVDEKQLCVSIKDGNTNYTLVLYNKTTKPKTKNEIVTNEKLDENNIAVFEITNRKTGLKFLLEYVQAVDNDRSCIIEKDYIWSVSCNRWTIETDCLYLDEETLSV